LEEKRYIFILTNSSANPQFPYGNFDHFSFKHIPGIMQEK
jgi:hypothetical protein